jgi:transcriptional regulator with XRE-family HTH domain
MSEQGILLREVRTQAGLTQLELAQKLGVSRGFISKVEAGFTPLPSDRARQIEELLDLPDGLMSEAGEKDGVLIGTMLRTLVESFVASEAPGEEVLMRFLWASIKDHLGSLSRQLLQNTERNELMSTASLTPSQYGEAVTPQALFATLSVLVRLARPESDATGTGLSELVRSSTEEFVVDERLREALKQFLLDRLSPVVGD